MSQLTTVFVETVRCLECEWEGTDRELVRVVRLDGQEEDTCPECGDDRVAYEWGGTFPDEFKE